MFWRDWGRKDLQHGDLNALLELKRGWNVPRQARLERLSDREFIEEDDRGKLRITVKDGLRCFWGGDSRQSTRTSHFAGRARLRGCKNDFAL